jgi:hypothetical protein
MSFTVICDECGSKQKFTNDSHKYEKNISIDVFVLGTYMGDSVEQIEINCENSDCGNEIEIKY